MLKIADSQGHPAMSLPGTDEEDCSGIYTYGDMRCESSCDSRVHCHHTTGENVRHLKVTGIHSHICEECGGKFRHFSRSISLRPVCRTCLEEGLSYSTSYESAMAHVPV